MARIVRFLKCFIVFLVQLLQDKCVHPFSLASVPCLNNRATATATITIRGRLASHRALQLQSNRNEYETEVLSHDPKCFLIHNFLSSEECQAYISKLSEVSPERIKQSNAPKVSLDIEKLWPLPFLCMGTGIPPLLRLLQEEEASFSSSSKVIAGHAAATAASSTDLTFLNNFIHTDLFWDRALSVVVPPILVSFGIVAILMMLVTASLQQVANQSARTSTSVALNTSQDCDFIRPLIEKASAITDHPWMNWEAPVVTQYSQGALFASHNDASPTKGSEWADLGGQRLVTVITYLNTCPRGGATKFDVLDFQVQPKEGSALVFFPADKESLKADGRTVHQSVSSSTWSHHDSQQGSHVVYIPYSFCFV